VKESQSRFAVNKRLESYRETKEVVSWYDSRDGQKVIVFTLGRIYQIESLGLGKRFRSWVELGLKTNSCNPIEISV
jgi:hypothetical protein